MKNKPCKAAIYTLWVGILVPLMLSFGYIFRLWHSHSVNTYFLLQEAVKLAEFFFSCAIFSLACAFLWDYLYRRYEL